MATGWITAVVAAIPASAVVVVSILRGRHPLNIVERLTKVTEVVTDQQVRRLIEDYRDERAARWVLEKRAPASRGLVWSSSACWVVGGMAFTYWLLTSLAFGPVHASWWGYGIGFVFFAGAGGLREWRALGRRDWIKQELGWRGMDLPTPAQAVRVANGAARRRKDPLPPGR